MKKQLLFLGGIILFGIVACNDTAPTTTTTATDSLKTSPGDTVVRTTTTTTTTTKTVHPIANFEHRTFYSVKSHKPVKLRMDTINHYYVDMTSNSQPDYFYYDPATKDTFDYLGRVVNNALIMNNGDYTIDESRLSDNNGVNTTTPDRTGNYKIKQQDGMYKEKTDTSKLKIKTK